MLNIIFGAKKNGLEKEAEEFLRLYSKESNCEAEFQNRLNEVKREIKNTGVYKQTEDEMIFGGKVAWRNNLQCIGKVQWKTLKVFDYRNASTEEEVFEGVMNHLRYATNGGKFLSTLTLFRPENPNNSEETIRIWNPQILRYAGYLQADGTVLGDPDHLEITREILKLGWNSIPENERTEFDYLPIVIQIGSKAPKFFDISRDEILEVPLIHPRISAFNELGLKWHGLPAIANMRFEIGGLNYTANIFNGWYVVTEICQNLLSPTRYNLFERIGKAIEVYQANGPEKEVWKDRVEAELKVAVMHSFSLKSAKIFDHHTAMKQFISLFEREEKEGRKVYAKLSWMYPHSYLFSAFYQTRVETKQLKPLIDYQPPAWELGAPVPKSRGEVLSYERYFYSEEDSARYELQLVASPQSKYITISRNLVFVGLFASFAYLMKMKYHFQHSYYENS